MIDYSRLIQALSQTDLAPLTLNLLPKLENGLCTKRFGDLPAWLDAFAKLPALKPSHLNVATTVEIGKASDASGQQLVELETHLRALMPWRKGPYHLFGLHIDTEWRSDWKWDRVAPHIQDLSDRNVLDVGCGNGYHCWRMYGAGARRVIGIDPSPRFAVQFEMIKKYFPVDTPVDLLPIGIEELPEKLRCFDSTFSMGVLYHRKSPIDHLYQLKDTLRPGGQLILETLTINGGVNDILVPPKRYAMMNNVWFIPSPLALVNWLQKAGYQNVACVDVNNTSFDEQRQTDWMRFHSLAQFCDPNDPKLTAEGHPAPQRSVFVATKPE